MFRNLRSPLLGVFLCGMTVAAWSSGQQYHDLDVPYVLRDTMVTDTMSLPELPSLEELIDSAISISPMCGYHNERGMEALAQLKIARRGWLQYIGVESYYRYGNQNVVDITTPGNSAGIPIVVKGSSNERQNWWYVGAYIRLPLSGLFVQGPDTKRVKHIYNQSEYERADAAQAVAMRVVELHGDLMLNLDILRLKAQLLETDNAQLQEAENAYVNRQIDLSRLAQLQEMQSKTAVEYATARNECRRSLVLLELISGIDITGNDMDFDLKLIRVKK